MADKSTILISAASFIILALGFTGFYLFFKSIFKSDIFTQNSENSLSSQEIFSLNIKRNLNINDKYFNSRKNIKWNGNISATSASAMSYGARFTDILVSLYEKRKKYILAAIFALFLCIFFIVFKNIFTSFFISIMSTAIINEFANGISEKRKEALDIQLIEFISNMIIMLKAGKEIRQIFKESYDFIKDPLKTHIRNLVNEVELNVSMDCALDNFAQNTGSREANLLANAIKINRKIGGNLLFILENIIKTLQENLKIKSRIKTQTAQNRFSGNFISLFPLAGFAGMYFFLNSGVAVFLSSRIGNILFVAGSLLEFSGFILIKKILRQDFL